MALPLILGLAALGAGAGYFGTSKKNRGKKGLKNALLGAVGGATLGAGTGALMGGGASALATPTAAFNAGGSSALAANAVPSAATMTGVGGGALTSAGTSGLTASTPLTFGSIVSKPSAGMMSKFMGNPITQGVATNQISGMLGGGNQEQIQTPQYQPPPPTEWGQGQVNPNTFSSMPLAMQQEAIRRYLNGLPQ